MPNSLELIAGPCVIESEEHLFFLAESIQVVAGDFVFKASFDKACGFRAMSISIPN